MTPRSLEHNLQNRHEAAHAPQTCCMRNAPKLNVRALLLLLVVALPVVHAGAFRLDAARATLDGDALVRERLSFEADGASCGMTWLTLTRNAPLATHGRAVGGTSCARWSSGVLVIEDGALPPMIHLEAAPLEPSLACVDEREAVASAARVVGHVHDVAVDMEARLTGAFPCR